MKEKTCADYTMQNDLSAKISKGKMLVMLAVDNPVINPAEDLREEDIANGTRCNGKQNDIDKRENCHSISK